MSLIHQLATGRPPGYDERRGPIPPLKLPLDTLYLNPADVPLVEGWKARGLDATAGLRIIASPSVPAGYVVTARDDVRARLDDLLERFEAAYRTGPLRP